MFATRHNNENAVYEQQQAAAAKPLNQGLKGLAAKTPGNKVPKTPFKAGLNDENAAFTNGKAGGKGQAGKAAGQAFITPAGPRTRAPLGNKTTNAKAAAFGTPLAPTSEQGKPSSRERTSPRFRRAKVKIHTAEADPLDDEAEEVPDIEYMPPREIPLPDHPDDCWPHDRTYPQFESGNMMRGLWNEFRPRTKWDEYGSEAEFSDFEEKVRKAEEEAARRKKAVKAPSTVKARDAAAALAKPSTKIAPSFAAPTTAAKARAREATAKKTAASDGDGNKRFTVAKAASNTTLGYAKGRTVSASARRPLFELHSVPDDHKVQPKQPRQVLNAGASRAEGRYGFPSEAVTASSLENEDMLDADGWDGGVLLELDEEFADFQLDMPEDL